MTNIAPRRSYTQTNEAARLLERTASSLAVLFAVVIAVISFGYTFLAYPQADDLERTGAMRIFSPLERITSDYLSIDGRWASKWLEYSCYRGGHVIAVYPALLTILLVIGIIGCCCGIAIISGQRVSEPSLLASGVVGYSFLWLSAPRGEIFYWFPAGAEYWLSLALGMVLLWLLYHSSAWWTKILVVTLSFFLPALHEVFGSCVFGVTAVTWLVRLVKRKAGSGIAGAATLAGTLGAASVVLSPGIRARAASSPHQPVLAAFHQALDIEADLSAHWVAMVPIFVVILLATARMRVRPSWYDESPLLVKSCLLAAMVPLPILMLTLISYGLGGGIPARVYDGFYILAATSTATFAAVCGFDVGRWDTAKKFIGQSWGSLLRSAAIILALAGAMSLPRFHAAFHDIDPAIRNRAFWVQRNAEIWAKRTADAHDVVVSQHMLPLSILPFYFDITEDPAFYANQHLATYYSLRSLRLSTLSLQTELAAPQFFDQILNQPPVGDSERVEPQCDFGIDWINGVSPATPPSVISDRLSVKGWTAISGKDGIVADKVFLTLSNAHQKLYLETRTEPRLDVNSHFAQPKMPESGFSTDVDVSQVTGVYALGLSRLYKGKLDSCQQLNIPVRFQR